MICKKNDRETIIKKIFDRQDEIGMSTYKLCKLSNMTFCNIRRIKDGYGLTLDSFVKLCNSVRLTIKLEESDEESNIEKYNH